MAFLKKVFAWKKRGAVPPQSLQESGLTAGTKLPADYLNEQWTATAEAITELQEKAVEKVTGKGLSTNDFTQAEKNKLSALVLNADLEEGAWQTPVLLNGFTANGVCRYKKTKNTLIIDMSVNGTSQGASVPIFNLPAIYRPLASKNPIFATIGGNTTAVRGFASTNGDVGVSTSATITGSFVGFTMQATIRLD